MTPSKSYLPVAAMTLVTSLAIEVSQLLNSRVTDVDDLLMNVVGAYRRLSVVWQTS